MSPVIKLCIEFVPTMARRPYMLDRTGNNTDSKPIKVLVDKVLRRSSESAIYRGTDTETNSLLALKLCFEKESIEALDTEARRYNELKEFQGDVVPICFGYFTGTVDTSPVACLVLEFCGEPLPCPFKELSLEQRYTRQSFKFTLHIF